ncbi:FAD-dependent oxidoreductase [Mixta theicola]|uniref:Protein FixC n=1 Tax=Mixta theicola TaxID=1458355 RepID=A0A2K1Q7N5_9GAMM|nr:FAD-dependent oxidoreductase [Mixta theicola]PNS11054.1 FAD-dependent oxidoreductase [Mixta theicola]GLR08399.1 FAD-dependent oxidoreductase [Mixta theicola]
MADDFNTIIIGAGIAGSTCALLCARAGLSVLLIERGEQPGSKNLSGGRLYGYALANIIPNFQATAPLERRITHEHFSLLTAEGATTLSGNHPVSESWSVLRARFDPWLAAQAEAAGAQLLCGVTVEALHKQGERITGVVCEGELLRAKTVVLAEGVNSELAERSGLIPPPSMDNMALGIKETLALDPALIQARFRLEEDQGAAWLFSGQLCGSKAGGGFLYTNRHSLSLGVVAPLSSLRDGPAAASTLLETLKSHPGVRPLVRETEVLEYGAHLVPEGGLHALPSRRGGEGWLLIGDTLRTCINTGLTVRGMDMAVLSAQAAANALIAGESEAHSPLATRYKQELQQSLLWQQLRRYRHLPALLQNSIWYQQGPAFCRSVLADLSRADATITPPLWRILLRHGHRAGLRRLSGLMLRSLKCL